MKNNLSSFNKKETIQLTDEKLNLILELKICRCRECHREFAISIYPIKYCPCCGKEKERWL